MAKQTQWTHGAGDLDWETSGNYDNGIPAAGDTLVLLSTASAGPSLNVDRTGDDPGGNGLDLALIVTEPDCTYDIASSSNPLKLVADKIVHNGSGAFYYKAESSGGGMVTDALIVDSRNRTNAFVLDFESANNMIGSLCLYSGHVNIKSGSTSASVTNCHMFARNDSNLILNVESTPITLIGNLHMNGGMLTCNATASTVDVIGGYAKFSRTQFDIRQYGGRVELNATGAWAAYRHYAGLLDLTKSGGAKTITSYSRGPDELAILWWNEGLHTITTEVTSH